MIPENQLPFLFVLLQTQLKIEIMISIQQFVFNSFMVNTYLLFDESGECIIIDPACYEEREKQVLKRFHKYEQSEACQKRQHPLPY